MLITINKRLTKHLWTYVQLVFTLLLVSHFANAQNVTTDVQIEKDTLIIGSEQDYPPFSTGNTDDTAGGFTIDLWKAVAAETGLKYIIRVKPFHELLKEFKEGKIDILINLATSKERHQFADFTVPHAVIRGGIFVRKDESKINSEADLAGKSIIVLNADLAHDYAISKGLSKQLILVDTAAEGMKLLASGKHDAMLISKLAGMQTLQKLGLNNINALKVNAGFEQKFTFAVQEGHSELLGKLNEALSMLKSNGTYGKLYEKWFGVYEVKEVMLVDVLKYLLPVLITFFAIALFSIHRRRIERETARKVLQESEAHLRLSQTVGGIGTWQADLVNHTQYWSENCISLLGFPPLSNPTWEDFLNLIHPEDRQRVIDATQAHIKHGKKYDVEYRAVSPNGQIRWLHSSGQVEHDTHGNPIAMRGIAQDISERKLLNIALADKELHFRTLLSTTPVGIFETDSKGECTYVNERWSKITGLSFELAKGNGWTKSLHPDDRDMVYAEWTSAVAENRAFHLEYRFLRSDGNEIWVLGQSVEFKNSAGMLGYIGSITDIHQQKLAEKVLIESENHSRAIIESSPVPLALNDDQGNITYLNTAFTQTLGYTISDIPTLEDWWPLAYPDAQYRHAVFERWQVNLDEAKLNNKPFTPMEINVWCKDNSIRTFMCSASDIHGNFAGNHLVTMYDITERKQAELEIKEMRHALVESHERYVDLYEFAPIGYLSLNKHGLITEVNWKITALFGLQRKELNLHRLAEFVAEGDADQWRRIFSDLKNLVDGEEYGFDLKFNHSKGAEFIASLNCIRMDDADNQPVLRITMIDVTKLKQAEDDLLRNEAYLSSIFDNEPGCIKVIDAKGCLKKINPAGLKLLEADSFEEATSIPLIEFVAPEYQQVFKDLNRRVIAGETMQLEFEIIGLKGIRRRVETHAAPMREGNKRLLLAVTRDITEHKIAENDLRIAAIAFESQEGMMITDSSRKVLRVNKAFTNITGYNADEMIGKNPSLLSSGQHGAAFYDAMWKSINDKGFWEGEIWNKRKSGDVYPEHLTITVVMNEMGIVSNYVATLTDITMSKAAAEEIQYLAFYDSLTKLPNRRLLLDRLNQALVSSARNHISGAILFIDLDHFKTLNDTLGHDVGDLLLQQVAIRLTACVREGDTVARLGGDEYVVMLEHLSENAIEAAAQAEAVGEKILVELSQPYQLASHEYNNTASIGVTVFSNQSQSREELLKHADIAMYQAKKAGSNTLRFFDPEMQEVIYNRVSLDSDLRKAIINMEFQLYYQVQVDGANHPIGAEALIRWNHPTQGLVLPFKFIQLAEETSLILPIGQWVLDAACAQLKVWEQNEYTRNLTLSINVSAKQFNQIDFIMQVQAAVHRHAINPSLLKLELTESMLIDHIDNIIITMVALQSIGVRFELDDFGTGYSSLQYLKQLPIYQLKIDQSFVHDIATDTNDQAIVRTIIVMAQSLNMVVIAEGVETESQRQFLLDNDCNHYQGFLFGRPVPVDQFEALLKQL